MGPRTVPHHGPVSPSCLIDCLTPVLSLMSFNPLARAYDAPFDPPRTVGDVLDLYWQDQLDKINGLGPRRISEIEAALVLAGLDIRATGAAGRAQPDEDTPVTLASSGAGDFVAPSPSTPAVNPGGGG